MSLPPWIKSIKRPLDRYASPPRHWEDLPDTEPGEELGTLPRLALLASDNSEDTTDDDEDDAFAQLDAYDPFANAPTGPPDSMIARSNSPGHLTDDDSAE